MNQKDQVKIINAGFTILRKEDLGTRLRIKFKDASNHNWRTLEDKFTSKAGLEKRMDYLLANSKTVED